MFRNILVPTDGSALSRKAIKRAVQLAKEQKARVTGFYVGPAWRARAADESIPYRIVSPEQHQANVKKTAQRILKAVESEAAKAGVPCTTSFSTDDFPYMKIVEAATRNGCDLILMATHGRRGMKRIVMGSDAEELVRSAPVPTLLVRAPA